MVTDGEGTGEGMGISASQDARCAVEGASRLTKPPCPRVGEGRLTATAGRQGRRVPWRRCAMAFISGPSLAQ